ncbi:hypothetical protein U1Q18_044998 [Sarracenia purpurea var. burkii]
MLNFGFVKGDCNYLGGPLTGLSELGLTYQDLKTILRRLHDRMYTKSMRPTMDLLQEIRIVKSALDFQVRDKLHSVPRVSSISKPSGDRAVLVRKEGTIGAMPEELFVPGNLYYLKRNVDNHGSSHNNEGREFFTLWRRHPGDHFQRILLSNNLFSDHKCDSHYYALRDVLKGFPGPIDESIFK